MIPLWWYRVGVTKLPCGCTRRRLTGRIILINFDCDEHMKGLRHG